MDNPLDNIVPDFSVFGVEFTSWWQKLVGGLWAALIIWAIVMLMVGIVGLRKATANGVPGQADEAKASVLWRAGALGLLVAFAVVVGVIINVAG